MPPPPVASVSVVALPLPLPHATQIHATPVKLVPFSRKHILPQCSWSLLAARRRNKPFLIRRQSFDKVDETFDSQFALIDHVIWSRKISADVLAHSDFIAHTSHKNQEEVKCKK